MEVFEVSLRHLLTQEYGIEFDSNNPHLTPKNPVWPSQYSYPHYYTIVVIIIGIIDVSIIIIQTAIIMMNTIITSIILFLASSSTSRNATATTTISRRRRTKTNKSVSRSFTTSVNNYAELFSGLACPCNPKSPEPTTVSP